MGGYISYARGVVKIVEVDPATAMSWMTQTVHQFTNLDAELNRVSQALVIDKEAQLTELVAMMRLGRYMFAIIIIVACIGIVSLIVILRRYVTKLDALNVSMTTMLDSLGQGLLFFDAQGRCSPTYSKACLDILQTDPANRHVADVLNLPATKRSTFQASIDMIFKGKMALGFSEFIPLAPKSYANTDGLSVDLDYRPIWNANGSLESILLVATDHTKEKEAQNIIKENEIAAARIMRIFHSRNDFIRFVKSFDSFLVNADALEPKQLLRDVHTLKGIADTFRLVKLAQALHATESDLAQAQDPGAIIDAHRTALKSAMEEGLTTAREILGDLFLSSGRVYSFPESQLIAFAERIRQSCAAGATDQLHQAYMQELVAVPLWQLLKEFAITLQELGDRFGKLIHPCSFVGVNLSVSPDPYNDLLASFAHIARNIVDHGIAFPDVRRERGKDHAATVSVKTQPFERNGSDWFFIEFEDDGEGIDPALLRKKLTARGFTNLDQVDDHSIIQHVFDGEGSTRNDATMLSGRNIGLNAVKVEVEKLGGTVEIFSTYGQGCRLRLELPLLSAGGR